MAGAFIVVLLVASGSGEDASTALVAKTAQNALDEQTIVVVRDVDSKRLLNHTEATRIGESLDASAIVVLSWKNRQQNASLHIRADRKKSDWIEKTLTFNDADPTTERMKTVGFEVAAIIARRGGPPPALPSSDTSLPPTTAPPRGSADDSNKAAQAAPDPPSSSAPPSTASDSPTTPERRSPSTESRTESARLAFDVVGLGAFAGSGGAGANGFGGEVGARAWLLNGWLAPHLAFGARFGGSSGDDGARATSSVLRGSVGVALRFVRPTQEKDRFGLGVRSDLHLFSHHLSHDDNPLSSGSALVGGASGMLEASWRWWRSVSMVGAGGIEVAFGDVDVFVDDRKASTIRPVRAVFEVGARWTTPEL